MIYLKGKKGLLIWRVFVRTYESVKTIIEMLSGTHGVNFFEKSRDRRPEDVSGLVVVADSRGNSSLVAHSHGRDRSSEH